MSEVRLVSTKKICGEINEQWFETPQGLWIVKYKWFKDYETKLVQKMLSIVG